MSLKLTLACGFTVSATLALPEIQSGVHIQVAVRVRVIGRGLPEVFAGAV
jgi:hypothetical protein